MHSMVIKAPWNRDQLTYDGGTVEKMLRFEVQNPTEEQKGGNHTALQGVKHVKRKLPHLRSVVSRSELGETYGCKLLAGQRVLSHIHGVLSQSYSSAWG